MSSKPPFTPAILRIDAARTAALIIGAVREIVAKRLRRRGAVIAVSGGIDSSVVAAICARALGREHVLALLMPERESSEATRSLGRLIVDHLGVEAVEEDITPILEAAGCYRRRDDAVRKAIPEYDGSWRFKIVLPSLADGQSLRLFSVIAQSPEGKEIRRRLPLASYLGVVAATNFKQRVRKMLEYYHADRLNYATAGTPNRLEFDQGFFVKLGDGAADLKPIAHLYKTQVYQLAEYLEIPEAIQKRPPTTDTYSLPQSQEEFYFSLPYDKLDLCLYGKNHGYSPSEVARVIGLTAEQAASVYNDIDQKRGATRYLHLPAQLVEEVHELADWQRGRPVTAEAAV